MRSILIFFLSCAFAIGGQTVMVDSSGKLAYPENLLSANTVVTNASLMAYSNTAAASLFAASNMSVSSSLIVSNEMRREVGASRTNLLSVSNQMAAAQTGLNTVSNWGNHATNKYLKGSTAWSMIYLDANTNSTMLPLGLAGRYLKSQGAASVPTWSALTATATNIGLSDLTNVVPVGYIVMGSGTGCVAISAYAFSTNYIGITSNQVLLVNGKNMMEGTLVMGTNGGQHEILGVKGIGFFTNDNSARYIDIENRNFVDGGGPWQINGSNILSVAELTTHTDLTVPTGVHGMGTIASSNNDAFYHASNPSAFVDQSVTNIVSDRLNLVTTNELVNQSVTNALSDRVNLITTNELVNQSVTNVLSDRVNMITTNELVNKSVTNALSDRVGLITTNELVNQSVTNVVSDRVNVLATQYQTTSNRASMAVLTNQTSVTIGPGSLASGNSTAIGPSDFADSASVAIGQAVVASNFSATFGYGSYANNKSLVQGYGSAAKARSFAQGDAVVVGTNTFGQGWDLTAGNNSVVIGSHIFAGDDEFIWGSSIGGHGPNTVTLEATNMWLGTIDMVGTLNGKATPAQITSATNDLRADIVPLIPAVGTIAPSNNTAYYHSSNPMGFVDQTVTNNLIGTETDPKYAAASNDFYRASNPLAFVDRTVTNDLVGTETDPKYAAASNDFYRASNPLSFVDRTITNGTASIDLVNTIVTNQSVDAGKLGGLSSEEIMAVGVPYFFTTNVITYGAVSGRSATLTVPTVSQVSVYTGPVTSGQYFASYLIPSNEMPAVLERGTYVFSFIGGHDSQPSKNPMIMGDLYVLDAQTGNTVQEFESGATIIPYGTNVLFQIQITTTNAVARDGYAFLLKTRCFDDGGYVGDFVSQFGKPYYPNFKINVVGAGTFVPFYEFSGYTNANNLVVSAVNTKVTNAWAITKDPSGWSGDYDSGPVYSFNTNTRVLRITNASPMTAYLKGVMITNATDMIFPAIGTNYGNWYIYWDGDSGILSASQTPWTLDDVQVASIYWQTTNALAIPYEELHSFMPWTVHRRFHLDPKLASAYISGMTLSVTNGTFQIGSGTWMDEDLYHVESTTTTNGYTASREPSGILHIRGPRWQYYLTNAAGALMYDANGTLTAMSGSGVANYMSMWCFVTPAKSYPVLWVVGRRTDTLANIRLESPPDISLVSPTAEAILMYQVILRGPTASFIEMTDFRLANVKGASAGVLAHNTLSGRDAANSHPIEALSGYENILTNIQDQLYRADGAIGLELKEMNGALVGAHISSQSGNAWVGLDSWDASGISWMDTNGNARIHLWERGIVDGGDEGILRVSNGSFVDMLTIGTQIVASVPIFWGTNQLAVNHQIFLESNRIDNLVYWKDNNVATFMHETLKDVDALWGNTLQLALDVAARSDYISMPGVNRITTTFAKGDTNGLDPLTSSGFVTNAGYMETKITNYTEGGTMTDTFHMNFNEANGATNFPDLAGVSWTEVGTPTRGTTTKKYGAGSIYLDGDGDYLTAPDEAAYEMGTNNWTMEMWVNTDNPESNMEFLTKVADSSVGPMRWLCSRGDGNPTAVTLMLNGNVIVTGSNVFNPAPNTWVHLAMVRDGNTIRSFTNGVLDGSATFSSAVNDTSDLWYLGAMAYRGSTSYDYEGYIDEFRYVVGSANYTNDFTPPESEVGTGGTTVYVKNKMTLVSKPTALGDSYSSVRSMIVWTNTDANVTNNVDIRHYWSLDNGSNWTQMLTARAGDVAGIPAYYSTNVTVPSGATALWKTECTNKLVKIYMHSGGVR